MQASVLGLALPGPCWCQLVLTALQMTSTFNCRILPERRAIQEEASCLHSTQAGAQRLKLQACGLPGGE